MRLAREEQRLVVFLEPIALYGMRDLHAAGDGGWLGTYPAAGERIAMGEVTTTGSGEDLAIVSFANGAYLSHQAQRVLEAEGISARVIDLNWLSPLPEDALLAATGGCGHVLIVDETRASGGIADALMTIFAEKDAANRPLARISARDSFIPTGPAYAATMPSAEQIIAAARQLVGAAR